MKYKKEKLNTKKPKTNTKKPKTNKLFTIKEIIVCFFLALSIIGIAFLKDNRKKTTVTNVEATSSEITSDDTKKPIYTKTHKYSKPASRLKSINTDDKTYEPSPCELNLAFYYPDDADTSDSINSYAGQIFTELMKMNTEYYASYYDLTDTTPLSIANNLGLSSERVLGQYDPRNTNHNIKDSSTWAIDSFKNINVVFKDSNGKKINGRYVVNEIMSMANVYSYYHDKNDADLVLDYCKKLFKSSLSASVSMGNVYYCSGCLHRSVYDEAIEAIAMDQNGVITEEDPNSSEYLENLKLQSRLQKIKFQMEETAFDKTERNTEETSLISDEDALSDSFGLGDEIDEANNKSSDINNTSSIIDGNQDVSSSDNENISNDETFIEETTKYAQISKLRFEELNSKKYKPDHKYGKTVETTEEETINISAEDLQESVAVRKGLADEPTTEIGPNYDKVDDFISEKSLNLDEEDEYDDSVLYSDKVLETKGDYLSDENISFGKTADSEAEEKEKKESLLTKEDREIMELLKKIPGVNSYSSYCPGHIDLYVTITVKGIDDYNSLFKVDTIGNDKNYFNDEWQGWTEDKIAYAKKLCEKDWFDNYGLTISAINVMEPLGIDEINKYLDTLPAGLDDSRRAVIEFALNSVGKVPYYWGGKPIRGGYESNDFYQLTSADEYGRILKGLDCSGWVNWVYWSVFGESLEGEGTGTLAACGKKIKRSELKPGDIIIRTGADAHVVMFLGWATDGNMVVIHETGGIINNVTVSCITANWPYYRSLINEEEDTKD